ncbi:flagellar hook-basal body complex protein FliE [Tuberibacillus sp. Marseille-P3662]|uniref:flagellar hook-basal body complex protein FliE n=1 Tax=Tuberibacillus sp. Marseille-P3662 TaxID=1965358 RepID=UPI000A1CEAF4|nr:flagellar hook-basal body complex protein FliE [Tuberibacillus sp. Marseille-P3662]
MSEFVNLANVQSNVRPGQQNHPSAAQAGKAFGHQLQQAIQNVNQSQNSAEQAITDLAQGQADNLHNVMIKMQKSEVMLQTTVNVRNKAVNAYREIMRMQI